MKTIYQFVLIILFSHFSAQAQDNGFVNTTSHMNYFIENKGQFNACVKHMDQIDFALHCNYDEVYFNAEGFQFHMLKQTIKNQPKDEFIEGNQKKLQRSEDWFNLRWVDGNPRAKCLPTGRTSHYYSYGSPEYLSYGYRDLRYEDIYPGIDVRYKINPRGGIEYILYIDAGADLEQVRLKYQAHEKVEIEVKDDNIHIKNSSGQLIESGLKAFYKNGQTINLVYKEDKGVITFQALESINKNKPFVIDPWVTSSGALTTLFSPSTHALDVDYDSQGNTYIMGGDYSGLQAARIAKYSTSGALLWVFPGFIATPSWTAAGLTGNFVVDKNTDKIYMSQGLGNPSIGATVVRLNSAGFYDSLIAITSPPIYEIFHLQFNCSTGEILALGGGTGGNRHFGVLDTTTGIINTSNITGLSPSTQDVSHVTLDANGEPYIIFGAPATPPWTISDRLFKLDATYTSSPWNTLSGFNVLDELTNSPNSGGMSSAGINCLDVNSSNLYYYDGKNLKAFDKVTGNAVGNTTSNSFQAKYQYGIYANDCDEVYVGMDNGSLHKYFFNGTDFILQDSLLIPGQPTSSIYDIIYNPITDQLNISGEGFVASINTQSTCPPPSSITPIDLGYNLYCPDSVVVSVLNANSNDAFSFTLLDSNTNTTLSSVTLPTGISTYGTSGLISGHTIQVQVTKTSSCQIVSKDTSFLLLCSDTTINRVKCKGDTINFGNQVISLPGIYIDTFTNINNMDSVVALIYSHYPTYTIIVDTSICNGDTYILPDSSTTMTGGIFIDSFTSVNGCDSVIITNLMVRPTYTFVLYDTLCGNKSFILPNGQTVTTNGSYPSLFTTIYGCDSNYMNNVYFIPIQTDTEYITICNEQAYTLPNGNIINNSGSYTSTFSTSEGCDSIIITDLTIRSENIDVIYDSICSTEFYTLPE